MRTVFPSQLTSEATAVTTSDWCVVQLNGETKLRKMRPGLLPDGAISTIKIADKAVTLEKIQDLSAYNLIGRASGTGAPAAIASTSFIFGLLDDADSATARATLGAAASSHTHSASDLPVGSGSNQVAAGNHTHSASDLPVGSGSNQVAAGNHNHSGVYALLGHNHSGVYALLGHDHSGVYALLGGADGQLFKTGNLRTSTGILERYENNAKVSSIGLGNGTYALNLYNDVGIRCVNVANSSWAALDCGSITYDSQHQRSDPRLKRDIQPPTVEPPSARLLEQAVCEFNFKTDPATARRRLGFDASVIAALAPDIVSQLTSNQILTSDDNIEQMLAIDMTALTAILVRQISRIEDRLASLEARL